MKAWIWFNKHPYRISHFLQGMGAVLVGVAAIIALSQTSNVLENVLKIQQQARDIQIAVQVLSEQVKQQKAEKVITGSSVFQIPQQATRQQIERAIIETIPTRPEDGVFIPIQNVEETATEIYQATSEAERIRILSGALKVSPFSSDFNSNFVQPAVQKPQNEKIHE